MTRMSVYTSGGVCGVAGNLPKERAPPPSKDPKHSENTLGRPCVSASWLGMDANWLLPSPMRPSASWSWIVPDSAFVHPKTTSRVPFVAGAMSPPKCILSRTRSPLTPLPSAYVLE